MVWNPRPWWHRWTTIRPLFGDVSASSDLALSSARLPEAGTKNELIAAQICTGIWGGNCSGIQVGTSICQRWLGTCPFLSCAHIQHQEKNSFQFFRHAYVLPGIRWKSVFHQTKVDSKRLWETGQGRFQLLSLIGIYWKENMASWMNICLGHMTYIDISQDSYQAGKKGKENEVLRFEMSPTNDVHQWYHTAAKEGAAQAGAVLFVLCVFIFFMRFVEVIDLLRFCVWPSLPRTEIRPQSASEDIWYMQRWWSVVGLVTSLPKFHRLLAHAHLQARCTKPAWARAKIV